MTCGCVVDIGAKASITAPAMIDVTSMTGMPTTTLRTYPIARNTD